MFWRYFGAQNPDGSKASEWFNDSMKPTSAFYMLLPSKPEEMSPKNLFGQVATGLSGLVRCRPPRKGRKGKGREGKGAEQCWFS